MDIDTLRQGMLNRDLGITTDGLEEPWGDATVRNTALCMAVKRLWPKMARLMHEDIDLVAGADEYELSEIWDVETLEVINPEGRIYKEMRNFRNYVDESNDPPSLRLQLPVFWPAGTTDRLRAVGYTPYTCIAEWQPET